VLENSGLLKTIEQKKFIFKCVALLDRIPFQLIYRIEEKLVKPRHMVSAWRNACSGFLLIIREKSGQIFGGVQTEAYDLKDVYETRGNGITLLFSLSKRAVY
jgi:hypothetical protein